jgi:hypothetical protein
MSSFTDLFTRRHLPQLALAVLLVYYLVAGLQIPESLMPFMQTIWAKVGLVVVALVLFAFSSPVVGVLGILAAYDILLKASSSSWDSLVDLSAYKPTQAHVNSPYSAFSQFPNDTLEQQMVRERGSRHFNTSYVKAPYRPVLENTHGAIRLTDF